MRQISPGSTVVCTTFPTISWLHWSACSFTDPIAVFRFDLSDRTRFDFQPIALQPQEIAQAQRYHRQEDRNRFMYTRCLLRILLGNYIHQPPHEICFTTGTNRKPELNDNTTWRFNVSHSGNCILIAIGKVSVGVDVERMVPDFDFQAIVAHNFSAGEQYYLKSSPNVRWAFYQLWTRKESLIKATAKGLDDDFALIPSLDGVHPVGSGLIGATGNWLVNSFSAYDDYPAAVAYPSINGLPEFYTLDSGLFAR